MVQSAQLCLCRCRGWQQSWSLWRCQRVSNWKIKICCPNDLETHVCYFRYECGSCIQELGLRDASHVKGFNQCQVSYHDYEQQFARSTEVILEETVCNDVTQQVCDSHWVIEANGDKVWEEDPSTCKSFEVTKCQQVQLPHTPCFIVRTKWNRISFFWNRFPSPRPALTMWLLPSASRQRFVAKLLETSVKSSTARSLSNKKLPSTRRFAMCQRMLLTGHRWNLYNNHQITANQK